MNRLEPNYVEDSRINLDQLEVEWAKHAEIEEAYIDQVSDKKQDLIDAIEKEKLAHEKVKSRRSKLIQYCHNHPERCVGKKSATGPEAEAYYRTHPDHVSAKRQHIRAQKRVLECEEEWETAKDMKDLIHFTKTKALEMLVGLWGDGYFSGPETPKHFDMRDFNSQMDKRRAQKLSSQIGSALTVQRNRR